MDITPYLDMKIAPRAVFDSLHDRGPRVRFHVPTPDGGTRPVTWAEHADEIRCVALYLDALGLGRGDRVAIFAPNRVEWLSAALGAQAMGGVMVPVYPSSTAEQAAYVVEHSDARVVFVDTPFVLARVFGMWSAYEGVLRVILLDSELSPEAVRADLASKGVAVPSAADVARKMVSWSAVVEQGRGLAAKDPDALERLMASVSLDDLGLQLYTSGTSGNPKGVPLTHRNVATNGQDWLRCNAPLIDEDATDLLWLPMSHIFGFGEACLGNTLGFTSTLTDPLSVLTKLPVVRPSVFMSVPSLFEKIAMSVMRESGVEARERRLAELTGGRLRFCLSGGAGLKREVKELFYEHGLLIIEGYGLTEASPTLTLNRPDAFRFDSVGRPLPSVELKLADDGEILARGASIFSGYHKDPEATADVFTEDGWLKTGDIGRFTDDGFLQIIDRKKDILVTAGGKNVAPANIEVRFNDDPYIAHVVVYGDGKRYLTAGIWLDEQAVNARLDGVGVAPERREEATWMLVRHSVDMVNGQLAKFETIKEFRIMETPLTVEGGFLTPTLKVKRKKVYEVFGAQLEELYA